MKVNMGEATMVVTVAEAARLLAVSTRTVHRLAVAGKIRIIRVTADAPRVLRADLEGYLASCAADQPADA